MDEGKTDRKLSSVDNHDDADAIEWPDWDDENDVGGYGKKNETEKDNPVFKISVWWFTPIGLQVDGTPKQKKNADRPTTDDQVLQ